MLAVKSGTEPSGGSNSISPSIGAGRVPGSSGTDDDDDEAASSFDGSDILEQGRAAPDRGALFGLQGRVN